MELMPNGRGNQGDNVQKARCNPRNTPEPPPHLQLTFTLPRLKDEPETFGRSLSMHGTNRRLKMPSVLNKHLLPQRRTLQTPCHSRNTYSTGMPKLLNLQP